MVYRIIRGANQIGGTITEIYTDTTSIFVDFGAELSVESGQSTDEGKFGLSETFSIYEGI